MDIAPAKTPLTLMDLNDDCLQHVLRFLGPLSELQASIAYPRLRQWMKASTREHFHWFMFDKRALLALPPQGHSETYREIAQLTQVLSFINIPEEDMLQVLPHFPSLGFLNLNLPKLKNFAAMDSLEFPHLHTLVLDTRNTDKAYLNALLRKLAPRLKNLGCAETPRADFAIVPHLEELTMNAIWLGKKSNFWRNNTTLRSLYISTIDSDDSFHDVGIVRENLKAIAAIPTLTSFSITKLFTDATLRPEVIPQLPHLRDVTLGLGNQRVLRAFLNNLSSAVTGLEVFTVGAGAAESRELVQLVAQRFPNLDKFTYDDGHVKSYDDLSPILENCKVLNTLGTLVDRPETYLQIFKASPALEALIDASTTKATLRYPKELREFAAREKRRIEIFSGDLA